LRDLYKYVGVSAQEVSIISLDQFHLRAYYYTLFYVFQVKFLSFTFSTMKFAGIIAAATALLPATLACNGYAGGIPKAVGTKTNSKVIEVAAGKVFDGQWNRYDRGNGACSGQSEGGMFSPSLSPTSQSMLTP
jgi:hypothetical protein